MYWLMRLARHDSTRTCQVVGHMSDMAGALSKARPCGTEQPAGWGKDLISVEMVGSWPSSSAESASSGGGNSQRVTEDRWKLVCTPEPGRLIADESCRRNTSHSDGILLSGMFSNSALVNIVAVPTTTAAEQGQRLSCAVGRVLSIDRRRSLHRTSGSFRCGEGLGLVADRHISFFRARHGKAEVLLSYFSFELQFRERKSRGDSSHCNAINGCGLGCYGPETSAGQECFAVAIGIMDVSKGGTTDVVPPIPGGRIWVETTTLTASVLPQIQSRSDLNLHTASSSGMD
jgi:hypothetical protein